VLYPQAMQRVYLLLGGNLGNRSMNLRTAREQITRFIGDIEKASSVYETEPWGFSHHIPFYNQAVVSATSLDPEKVLYALRKIEEGLGRKKEKGQYSARTIDIDILFYEDRVINEKDLVIPHPRLHERRFALAPLVEIAPLLGHPVLGKTIDTLYEQCDDNSIVKRIESG
jgi:2-amino-4-hydroxy-6-hydroxymethyldihydropteridine diphosphokinase